MFLKILEIKNSYINNEDGATAIEYGLIAAGIALVISGAVFVFGGELNTVIESLSGALDGTAS